MLSIYLRFLVIYGAFSVSIYCGNSCCYHGFGEYFVRLLPSTNFISEPQISAGAFRYLVMLLIYWLTQFMDCLDPCVWYVLRVWYLSYSFLPVHLLHFKVRYVCLPDLTAYILSGSWSIRAIRHHFSLCAWC